MTACPCSCAPIQQVSVAILALLSVLWFWPVDSALAYRPFDSTDADVAQTGVLDLELGPVGYLQQGPDKFLLLPTAVVNFGIADEREIVFEGKVRQGWDVSADIPSTSLVDTGLSVKRVLREGSLQHQSGPSIAAEYGLLLPTVHAESGMGASLSGIVSQRCRAGTIHLNAAIILNRDHRRETFWGLIGEAPFAWPVRPVAEIYVEEAVTTRRTVSGLVGAIWRFRDNLSLDIGFRVARSDDEKDREWRLGFTWSVPYRRAS